MSEWWKSAVFYQIYPRSFCDTNGDGIGDLEGIRRRLDHLEWLGVDAIWISPFFRSPVKDYGYDVSDYCDVDPLFGDLAAFDQLLEDAHAREIRVMIDWVPNHSSDLHPWFIEVSRRIRPEIYYAGLGMAGTYAFVVAIQREQRGVAGSPQRLVGMWPWASAWAH